MSNTLKKLLIALGIVLVASGGVYLYITSAPDETIPENASPRGGVALETSKILADIQKIDGYVLNMEIFDDARFTTLVDFGVSIPEVNTGRKNPFEPITN